MLIFLSVSYLFQTQRFQILVCTIIELWQARRVFGEAVRTHLVVASRHADDNTLTSSCQQHAVGVEHIFPVLHVVLRIPLVLAVEFIVGPTTILASHIGIPQHAGIVEFQSLHLYLCSGVLQIVRRSDVCLVFKKPMYCILV